MRSGAFIIHDQIEIDTGHKFIQVFILIQVNVNCSIFNGTVVIALLSNQTLDWQSLKIAQTLMAKQNLTMPPTIFEDQKQFLEVSYNLSMSGIAGNVAGFRGVQTICGFANDISRNFAASPPPSGPSTVHQDRRRTPGLLAWCITSARPSRPSMAMRVLTSTANSRKRLFSPSMSIQRAERYKKVGFFSKKEKFGKTTKKM